MKFLKYRSSRQERYLKRKRIIMRHAIKKWRQRNKLLIKLGRYNDVDDLKIFGTKNKSLWKK